MKTTSLAAAALALTAGLAPGSSVAGAETTPRFEVEEVVVTARRREERLLDVPVSASVLSGEDLERYNTTSLTDIGTLVPNVNFLSVGSGAGGVLMIRGLGSSSGDAGIEQSVLVNMDGIPMSRGGRITRFAFFDLEALEVLKGPQALFFGKNSPAGVVATRSRSPGAEREVSVTAGHEFESTEWFGEAAVSGPISDTLRARLAVRGERLKGWMKNVAQPMPNPFQPDQPLPGNTSGANRPDSRTHAARLTLEYQPNERLANTFRLFGVRYEDNGEHLAYERIRCADGASAPTTFGVPDPYGDCRMNARTAMGSQPTEIGERWPHTNNGVPFSEVHGWVASNELAYELESATLHSVTGLWGLNSDNYDASDVTTLVQLSGSNNEQGTVFTQELRLVSNLDGRWNYNAGVFYENAERRWFNTGKIAPLPADPFTGKFHTWEQHSEVGSDTYSAYLQLVYRLTDTLELGGGARYTRVETDVKLANTYVHPFFPVPGFFLPVGQVVTGDRTDDDVSPEVTLTWHVRDDWMVFAAYKTGYKAGGFSTPGVLSGDRDARTSQFESESASGFEVGSKFRLLEGRLTGTASAYRYTFDDLQLTQFDSTTTTFNIRNAAKLVSQGVELEGRYWILPEFAVRLAGAYNDAEFDRFPNAPCYTGQTAAEGCVGGVQDLSGARPAANSKWEWHVGALYDAALPGGWRLAGSADLRRRSSFEGSITNIPWAKRPSLTLLDASLQITDPSDTWSFALYGRNLLDKLWTTGADTPAGGQRGELAGTLQRTREIGLQASYRM